jgi:hypothetical protein
VAALVKTFDTKQLLDVLIAVGAIDRRRWRSTAPACQLDAKHGRYRISGFAQ